MKKWRSTLCLLCLALLVPGMLWARGQLPADTHALIEQKYAGWSGVLRLWVCLDWQPGAGTLAGWLNRCVSAYEKRHPGVYVQPQYVEAADLAGIGASGILPPDMILFSPGLLDAPTGLLPLDARQALRQPLKRAGDWSGACYAAPVAMGGYCWALNAALCPALPDTWRGTGTALAVSESRGAALLGLCAYRYGAEGVSQAPSAPGLSLGLPEATAAPATLPPEDDTLPACELPEDFRFSEEPWRAFVNGEAGATVVDAREVRRLRALSDQGRGPDWRLASSGAAFTDQLACLGIVDKGRPETQALCGAFLDHLLSDECQGALADAGAFSVTSAWSGYAGGDPLLALEAALRDEGLLAAGALDGAWRENAGAIVREFIAGTRPAPDAWRELRRSLG